MNLGLGLSLGTVRSSGGGGGGALDFTPRTLTPSAVRTWYNNPVVLADGTRLYAGAVASDGSVTLTKATNLADTVITLNEKLEVDDHNEAAIIKLPGGKLGTFYSRHGTDTVGVRSRVSTNNAPDMRSFATETLIADGGVATSYALPTLLNDGNVRVFFRSGGSGATTRPRKMAKATAASVEAGSATWTITNIFETASGRPYLVKADGTDLIHFAITSGHPNEVSTLLYHCYMQIVAGVERFYTSAGVEITGLPIDPTTQATLVDDATGGRVWVDKIAIGPDGHPRILFMKYPTGTTGANTANAGAGTTYNDIEYWHARWTGSAWVKNRISTGQRSLYPTESFYHGGMDFDGNDVTTLYLCEIVSGQYEIRQYTFNEATGIKTLVRDITTGSVNPNFRPESPTGGSRPWAVTWINGVYTTFTNYNTSMRGAGATAASFTPAALFADSEIGGWWDASDFATMWQDTAGTVPVTATGQSVARINDKSGNGYNLLQATAGSRPILQQDGGGRFYLDFATDRFLSVASFDLSTCTGVSVFAGIRKTSDAAAGIVVEHSTSSSITNRTFALFAPAGATPTFAFRSRGTVGDALATASGFASPLTAVITATGEIAGDHSILRVNGAQAATSTVDQGNGPYISDTLFVGRRAGTSTPFNGRLYGLIIRGARSGQLAISNTEEWMNAKTGAY